MSIDVYGCARVFVGFGDDGYTVTNTISFCSLSFTSFSSLKCLCTLSCFLWMFVYLSFLHFVIFFKAVRMMFALISSLLQYFILVIFCFHSHNNIPTDIIHSTRICRLTMLNLWTAGIVKNRILKYNMIRQLAR